MSERKQILIVEDELSLGKALGRILEKEGFQVHGSSNVADAIATLNRESIDLCVTDLAMPGETGLDLLKQIRNHPRYKTLPVIVQSGFANKAQNDVLAFNPLRIFQKPAPIQDLLWAIRDGLGIKQPQS